MRTHFFHSSNICTGFVAKEFFHSFWVVIPPETVRTNIHFLVVVHGTRLFTSSYCTLLVAVAPYGW
jgi:hypothetical protein